MQETIARRGNRGYIDSQQQGKTEILGNIRNYVHPPSNLALGREWRAMMQFSAWSRRAIATVSIIGLIILANLPAHAQPTLKLGDSCQLTQSAEACARVAKASPKPASGLWAAVAVSGSTLVAGVAHGQASQSAAEKLAIAKCAAMGAKDCTVTNWVQGSCVGYAGNVMSVGSATMTFSGYGKGSDRATAESQAIANCKGGPQVHCTINVTACAGDNPAYASPLPLPSGGQPGSVDPNWVGAWELDPYGPNAGRWVMQISANGTYEVHSEALDATPSSVGTFSAKNGSYTLRATNISWDDTGTYSFQSPGTMVATGKLGTGTWNKIAKDGE
jgi:hypothetical protein